MLKPQVLQVVREYLVQFAASPDFESSIEGIFGTKVGVSAIRQQWLNGDFGLIPEVRALANGELGTANGAYAGSLDKILVSAEFLAGHQDDVEAVAGLLLEEIGHKLDRVLNGNIDSPGDEGAIFRIFATGQTLSAEMLAGLRAQDDRSVISIDGQSLAVEEQSFTGTAGNDIFIGTAGDDIFRPGTGADTIDGGEGDDDFLIIINSLDTADTNINYTNTVNGTIIGGFNNGTTFKNIERFNLTTGSGNDNINVSTATPLNPLFTISAGVGNDTIVGSKNAVQTLYGDDGNDNITGGNGNDFLLGGAGDDILIGVDVNNISSVGENSDFFTGGTGSDTFVLGDSNRTFYGDPTKLSGDFVIISDFNPLEDKVQLNGLASNYILKVVSILGFSDGTILYIDKHGVGLDEQIAIFLNVTGLSMTSEAFTYVGAVSVNPTISVTANNPNAAEPPNPGQFTLTRTGGLAQPLTVAYTISGTATNGADYQNLSGIVTFGAGSNTTTIDLNVLDDNIFEGTETATITLTANAAYTLATANTATVNIVDNDPQPLIDISSVSLQEGDSGTKSAIFVASLSNPSTQPITVDYAVTDGTANSITDFYKVVKTTFTFLPGQTTKNIIVGIIGDTEVEPDEIFALDLSNPTNATLGTNKSGIGTILNDDTVTVPVLPTISVVANDPDAAETKSSATLNPGQFTLTRMGDLVQPLTVAYTISGTATNGTDYQTLPGTIAFAAGQNSVKIDLNVLADNIAEETETAILTIASSPAYAFDPANSATINIEDKRSKGQVTIVLAGENFSPTDQISLVAENGTVKAASKTYWVSNTEAWATFDLQGTTVGAYDIKVENGQNNTTANNAFTVTDGAAGNVKFVLSYPAGGVVRVTYTNIGQTDVIAPLFKLNSTNAQVTIQPENISNVVFSLGLGTSNNGPAGILSAGESGEVSFAYTLNGNGLINFDVEQINPNDIIDWASIKAQSRADYSFIDNDGWDALWTNLTASLGQTYGQFQAVMAENANYLSQLGQWKNLANSFTNVTYQSQSAQPSSNLARLFAFEWQQAANTLTNTDLISTTDIFDAAPGLSLDFNRTFHQSLTERYNLGSFGRGWSSQWDIQASSDTQGDVIIRRIGGLQRFFTKQTNGTFTEDNGTILSVANGQYRLQESNGLVSLFDADGKLNYVQDPNGNRITLQYTNGQLNQLIHSNGDRLTIAYNAQGRIDQIADSTGQVTQYSYDASGEHLLSVTGPAGTTSYTYDTGNIAGKKHSLLSVTADLGYQRSFEYDNQGRLTKEFSNGQTQSLTYSYDNIGGVNVTDVTGATQTVLLDDRGNAGQIRGVDNQNLLLRYNANGNLTSTTLPDGSKPFYSYDANGNLTSQVNLLGQATNFIYDPTFNRLTGFTDPKGNGVGYSYDTKGNLTKITYADGSTQQFGVDGLGNVTTTINRRDNAIQYTHNTSGLLTKKQYPDGASITYAYDTKGNLTGATDATGTIIMQYDTANQLTKITYPTGRSLSYTYNAAGQRTQLVTSDGYTTKL
jgi:YD repeat-containing protein